jgi:two-component system, NarL family, nitrate/nitrite response regulator NarL
LEGWPMGTPRSVSTKLAHPEIRVLPVADVRLYREGLANCLASRAGLQVVGMAANRDEALALVASLQPDVVVMDMATRDSLAIVRAINGSTPAVRIIAFAIEPLDREILACAEAGVAGYVHSEASTDDLVAAIESVMRDELLCPPRTAALLLRRLALLAKTKPQPNTVDLTVREREIGLLIDDGLSNKEIAQRLNIEVATVKNHVHNILEKLHVPSRAQAAAHLRATLGHVSRSAAFDRLESDPGAKV